MPASPDDGARLAARVLDIISRVELTLIDLIATRLRAGINSPGWEAAKLAEVRLLRQRLAAGVQRATPQVIGEVNVIIHEAYSHGQALARIDTTDAHLPFALPADSLAAVDALAKQARTNVVDALALVPDLLTTVYEDAVRAAVEEAATGSITWQQAAQRVLDDLAERGVTGFRDKAGRNWALESYAEMAVRTGGGHAAVQGHVDTLAASGIDLIIVSDAPRECPLCRPWERQILSISGRVGAIIEPSVVGGSAVRVNVKASLADARAAGFQHPNCRHTVLAYLPGATEQGVAKSEPERYEAGQRQREIERRIRAWKRRKALALDAAGQRQAAVKIREWQAVLREHIDQHDLPRISRREQIGKAI